MPRDEMEMQWLRNRVADLRFDAIRFLEKAQQLGLTTVAVELDDAVKAIRNAEAALSDARTDPADRNIGPETAGGRHG